jgi:glycolate oxidase
MIPGGMEMMDPLAVKAAEALVHAGYPLEAEALLIVELDGCEAEIDHLVAVVEGIAARHGATTCRTSRSEAERLLFRAGRKAAFPAVGRIT